MNNLNKFLAKAKIATYAGDGRSKNLEDGSKELTYEEKEFSYKDRYFGFDPFIGEEVVFQNKKPIWSMNYYGFLTSSALSAKQVYEFLKKALRQVKENQPYRGPENYKEKDLEYANQVTGTINAFIGTEKIKYKRKEIYKLDYHGGLIKEK